MKIWTDKSTEFASHRWHSTQGCLEKVQSHPQYMKIHFGGKKTLIELSTLRNEGIDVISPLHLNKFSKINLVRKKNVFL